jgi:hypothetical protein
MVIEDPQTGEAQLGLGIYYLDLAITNIDERDTPSINMGIIGDLAVMF